MSMLDFSQFRTASTAAVVPMPYRVASPAPPPPPQPRLYAGLPVRRNFASSSPAPAPTQTLSDPQELSSLGGPSPAPPPSPSAQLVNIPGMGTAQRSTFATTPAAAPPAACTIFGLPCWVVYTAAGVAVVGVGIVVVKRSRKKGRTQ